MRGWIYFLLFCLPLSACLFLGACHANQVEETVKTEKEPITLNTVSMYAEEDPNTEVYQSINEEFMDEWENVYIEDNSQIASQSWKALIAADFAVDNEPDVIQFFTDGNASEVLKADKFVSLEEIRSIYPEYANDILPVALEAARNPDGVMRAVPTTGYWEGLYCNRDLFEQYGLELPTDWNKFIRAIYVFKENGVIPIAVSLSEIPHYWLEHLLLFESGAENYLTVPEEVPKDWVKALNLLKKLNKLGAFPENVLTIDGANAKDLFNEKKAAMQLEGSWCLGSIADQENTVVCAFPQPEKGKAETGTIIAGISSGFYITRRAWNDPAKREVAVKFVMAHTNKEAVQRYWRGVGQAATEVEAQEDMTSLQISGMEFSQSARQIYSPLDSRMSQSAYSVLINGIAEVVSGSREAQSLLEEVLEKER